MADLGFDGKVAIITGAGGGLGRSHALELARRGARVVVNDLGGAVDGSGSDAGAAQLVVDEIKAAGGEAVANTDSVATPEGGAAVVETAIENFGRIDILIANAGIIRWGALPEVEPEDLQRHLAVHLLGAFNTLRPAWPHFVGQRYGRVVLTASSGVFGKADNLSYAAAKAGVIGLARSARLAGEPHGIKVNVIAPAAQTRMGGGEPSGEETAAVPGRPHLPSDAVAPMAAFLAHESCPVSGEIYTAGAGRFARLFIASTEGYVHREGPASIEDVAANWAAINDEAGYFVPADLMGWSGSFLGHQLARER